jgi:hypothetical protein
MVSMLRNPLHVRTASALLTLALLPFAGCSIHPNGTGLADPPTGLVFGGPAMDAKLEPFQGVWKFESRRSEPETDGAVTGGPGITITGHIIRFGDFPSEIRLCQIARDESGITAEGWHHEDIDDPGDMQRVECALQIKDESLELRWRMVPDAGFSDDPVIAAPDHVRPVHPPDAEVTPWWIETYSRKDAR